MTDEPPPTPDQIANGRALLVVVLLSILATIVFLLVCGFRVFTA